MAHTCPECGLLCHCGGDIDDCEFDGTPEQLNCSHCDENDDDRPESEDEDSQPTPAEVNRVMPNLKSRKID